MKILITGVNGFIGNWLARAILKDVSFQVTGIDIKKCNLDHPVDSMMSNPKFSFQNLNLLDENNSSQIEKMVEENDIIIPLAAIANPYLYIKEPLRVFQLDFEHNLHIVKLANKYGKRIIFPSTSEVYGMAEDVVFDEESTKLVMGPVQKMRWIYACSKQLLDRVICAYGLHEGLSYTLFRPFNWIGPRLDNIDSQSEGESRAFTQFMSNVMQGRPICIVNDGLQRRTFIYIDDAIEALIKIIKNENQCAHNKIYNIGNPENDFSIHELAKAMISHAQKFPHLVKDREKCKIEMVHSDDYFGQSYEDVSRRMPSIKRAMDDLNWQPTTSIDDAIEKTFRFYEKTS
ncbi:MAG: bifunctional UDP-4-keto-pentose/UDP-xylose synthase [Alphaproteobacteria bacterium]|nr:MAG: bifunctional UDP-4-keto-pentose/UDP-xylose synthase [Alphaproteobacteria bacterium]